MLKWILALSPFLFAMPAYATGEWYDNTGGSGTEIFALEAGQVAYFRSAGTATDDSITIDTSQCELTRVWLIQSSGSGATGYVIETTDTGKTYTAKILKDHDFDGVIDDDPLNGDPTENLDRIQFRGAIRIYIDLQAAAGSGEVAIFAASCVGDASQ